MFQRHSAEVKSGPAMYVIILFEVAAWARSVVGLRGK